MSGNKLNAKAKFYLYMRQKGEGCDYTIGCAQRTVALKAQSWDDARKEALEFVGDDADSDSALQEVVVIEAFQVVSLDVQEHYADKAAERRAAVEREKVDAEKREFERLRAKFERPR